MLSPTAKKIDMNSPRRINNTTESPDFMEGSKNPIKICVQSSGNMVIQKMTLQSRQIQPQGMIWQK